jgi:hypothetical protein
MTKKEATLIALLVGVGCVYIIFFTNWFVKKQIVITPSLRPATGKGAAVLPVIFKLDGEYKLTNVKVVPLDSENFQPQALAAWHLVAQSNSEPTRMIVYGKPIPGMQPALKGTQPEPLDPNVIYRLDVAAGPLTGTVDFRTQPARK